MKILPMLFVLLCVCGCSPQKSLAHRLKGADRVIVTHSPYAPVTTLTGEEVNQVVQALASAPKGGEDVKSSPCFQLEIFKGSEQLATAWVGYSVFGIDGTRYSYSTGTLQVLFEKFYNPNFPLLPP